MEQIISKEEFNELMKIKGEVRGMGTKTVMDFVLKEEGEKGLKKLEEALLKLGHPVKYKDITTFGLYPLNWYAVSLLLAKKIFNYNDKKFQEIGKLTAKIPFTMRRVFMKYLISIERALKLASKIWKVYFTVGDMKVIEFDKEKRRAIVRLENFPLHPLYCQLITGSFVAILEALFKGKVGCKETKCSFRGDEYHEFLLNW